MHEMSDEESSLKLKKGLMGRRYLIVMDDIWSVGPWDCLKRSFPDDNNGSRIMFTSRLQDAALHAQPDSHPHYLRFLTEYESWHLFQQKVFGNETCPGELTGSGKKITKKCVGLPLTIIVMAGLLASIDKTEESWEHVATNVSSHILTDPKQFMNTLGLSYNHLPHHLKACFLYLGLFGGSSEIPVRNLIWSWVAGGFIKKIEQIFLEDVVKDYLLDLISRSLVIVVKKGSDGGIGLLNNYLICPDFQLVRVLDLSSFRVDSFPSKIVQLVDLRYLALRAHDGSLPESISNLRNLETFILSSGRNITVPQYFWKIVTLRHLYIKSGINVIEYPCFGDPSTGDDSPSVLADLQTISQVCPSRSCQDVLAKTPNLRELGFCGPLISNSGDLIFPDLSCKNHLETLKLLNTRNVVHGVTSSLCDSFKFPEKLKRITLSGTNLKWSEMWMLGILPNLEVLKLKFHACVGPQWETCDGGFCRLKFLKFEDRILSAGMPPLVTSHAFSV
ncbi:hypothetical protein F0562_034327 [Nyssa sinensis]|uniref:Uncharacterized protein n=1 Tax=Nyssa sinensis TaxID=561372 RepID=A0A5J5AJD4_9ASTE|nr:hypothetical protein F0562_034327 [Nyssa sinensis]